MKQLHGTWRQSRIPIDWPQATSAWRLEPRLHRESVSPWGDFESFFPLGLHPLHLTRSDNLAGDASFPSAVPLPLGDEFVRAEAADDMILLDPGSSGVYSPLGGALSAYAIHELRDADTSLSEIAVTRGRGGFADTEFRFHNRFGPLGSVNAAGGFQKLDGFFASSNAKVDRMRFVAQPPLGRRWQSRFLYAFNRVRGTRRYFPDEFRYSGFTTDFARVWSSQLHYYASERAQYRLELNWKTYDQKFDARSWKTAQKYDVVEAAAVREHSTPGHRLEIAADTRWLRLRDQGQSRDDVAFRLGATDMIDLRNSAALVLSAAVVGSAEVPIRPNLLAALHVEPWDAASLMASVFYRNVVPSPVLYLSAVKDIALDSDTTYLRIRPESDLESGRVFGGDMMIHQRAARWEMRLRFGIWGLRDLAQWQRRSDDSLNFSFAVEPAQGTLAHASIEGRLRPHPRLALDFGYGLRQLRDDGSSLHLGSSSVGSAQVLYSIPVARYSIRLNLGLGARYYSAVDRRLFGSAEEGVALLDAYSGFDLKRFHFFLNFNNLTDFVYTSGSRRQPGRSVWWGFRWAFVD